MFPIIEKLGGWEKVEDLLEEAGVATNSNATKRWKLPERGMPAKAKFALATEAKRRRIPWTEDDFIYRQKEAA